MINTELLKKYIAGNVTQEEKEAVQLWLEADPKNTKELMALRTLYDITLAHLDAPGHLRQVRKQTTRKFFRQIAKVAAVALVVIAISYTLIEYFDARKEIPAMQSLFVPPGQRAELTLADGTVVWLNAQSRLTFPSQFDKTNREVFLNGEGYFKVAKSNNRKFIVNTHLYHINVLGTEFNVSAYSKLKRFETSLIKGSVEVVSKDMKEKITLHPGQYVSLSNDSLKLGDITHHNYFLWRDGIISFEHERVGDILNKLRVIYDVDIQNYNKSIEDMRHTCKFHTKDGIDHIMSVLKISFQFQYKKADENNQIIIW